MPNLPPWKHIGACLLFCAAAAIFSSAQTFTTLANFDFTNGAFAYGSLVQGVDGNFYGATGNGGGDPKAPCSYRCGVIFKITPGGTLTVAHYMCSGVPCTDGYDPSTLTLGTNGDLYGITNGGGDIADISNCPPATLGCGTFFYISPQGTLLTQHTFDGVDGAGPGALGALVQAFNGNFYGTASSGEANQVGAVFEMTPAGMLTTLHTFDRTDGAYPNLGLVQASDGSLYGSTSEGGLYGFGTIFRISPDGAFFLTLYNFPTNVGTVSPLVVGPNGNLYGTTAAWGANSKLCGTIGCGMVFEITPQGTLTKLHNFDFTDGDLPNGPLVLATDGNFYGTTRYGGVPNGFGCQAECGTIFQITPTGTLTTVHVFQRPGGEGPEGGLVQGTDGNFYGTTAGWGQNICEGCGTVYSLSMGLAPFVRTVPRAGYAGQNVIILGTDLTGATSVTFNGTAAAFTIVSATEITTTVPTGATTGTLQVVTPSGTLSSSFRVFF
jgi:uncharacterized repeat protein (TIGR03803 family)